MKSKNHLSYPFVWNLDLQEKISSVGLKGLCVCESNVTGSASGVGFFFLSFFPFVPVCFLLHVYYEEFETPNF